MIEKINGFPSESVSRREEHTWFLALAVFYLVFLNPHIDMRTFNGHDPSNYLARAVSMLAGNGYSETFVEGVFPVTIQTPGVSIWQLPVIALFGMNFVAIKLMMTVWGLLLIPVSCQFFKQFMVDKKLAFLSTLVLMTSPVIFGLSHRVLAEVPLITTTLFSLTHLERYLKNNGGVFGRNLWLAYLGFTAAYFFKITAVGIVPGAFLLLMHPKYWKKEVLIKTLVFAGLCAVPLLYWKIRNAAIDPIWYWANSPNYFMNKVNPLDASSAWMTLSDWIMRIRENLAWGILPNLVIIFLPFLFDLRAEGFVLYLSLPLAVFIAVRWLMFYMRRPSVIDGFAVSGYFLLVISFKGLAIRYSAYFYPVLLIYVFTALSRLPAQWRYAIPKFIFAGGLVSCLVMGTAYVIDPFANEVVAEYVKITRQADTMLPNSVIGRVPLPSHWRALTGRLTFRAAPKTDGSGSLPDYFVYLSDNAARRQDLFNQKALPRQIIREASAVRKEVKASGRYPLEVIAENDLFTVAKAAA